MRFGGLAIPVGAAVVVLLASPLGCAPTPTTPPGATAGAAFNDQVTAVVVGVDRPRRLITLQSPDGQTTQVYASDAVRNFDRIQPGDRVRLTVHTDVQVTAAGNVALPGVIVEQRGGTAPVGSKPAGVWASRTQRSVQIVSVDKVGHTVTFREPDGTIDSFTVQNPANYALADGLQPGSYVTVVRTDAVAVSVDKI